MSEHDSNIVTAPQPGTPKTGKEKTDPVTESLEMPSIDWKKAFTNLGQFFDMLLSGFAGLFSDKDYDFEGKYHRLTGEEWRPSGPMPWEVKPESLKEPWEQANPPAILSRPDGTAYDLEGRTLSRTEAIVAREEAVLTAMQKGRISDRPGTPSNAEEASAEMRAAFKGAHDNTAADPSSAPENSPAPAAGSPKP